MVLLALVLGLAACQTVPTSQTGDTPTVITKEAKERFDLIAEMKAYEEKLGWKPTNNFREYSDKFITYPFCVIVPPLSFYAMTTTLTREQCAEAGKINDTKYFESDAVAGKRIPLSSTLVAISLDRFIYAVFHEDFHEQVWGIPSLALNESATQLNGLLAARDFTREKYGEGSERYHFFARLVEDFLANALIQKRYYQELGQVYADVRAGKMDAESGLKQKARLYDHMHMECSSVNLVIFASCEHLNNNAMFAQSMLYTGYYPMFYDLYRSCGSDTKRSNHAVIALVAATPKGTSESEFAKQVERSIQGGCSAPN